MSPNSTTTAIFNEVLQQLGVPAMSIKHGLTTMPSEKWIVCMEPRQVLMVDLATTAQVTCHPTQAEAATMYPASAILALHNGLTLRSFTFELKLNMKNHQLPAPVVFWQWMSPSNLAPITATLVYHWPISGNAPPRKVFTHHVTLPPNVQLITYQVSPNEKWALLGGSAGTNRQVNANMQLNSVEKNMSQSLQDHAAAFTKVSLAGHDDPAQLLCFHEKKPDAPVHKIYIMNVGHDPSKRQHFCIPSTHVSFPPDTATDFPMHLNVDSKNDITYMITKMGYLHMFDVHTIKPLYRAIYHFGVANLAHSLSYFDPAEVLSFVILPLSQAWQKVTCVNAYELIGKTFIWVEELVTCDAATQARVPVGMHKVTLLTVEHNNNYAPRGYLEFFVEFIPRALLVASPLDVAVPCVYFNLYNGKVVQPYLHANAQVNMAPTVLDVKKNF
jgi:hypothetical protein